MGDGEGGTFYMYNVVVGGDAFVEGSDPLGGSCHPKVTVLSQGLPHPTERWSFDSVNHSNAVCGKTPSCMKRRR